MNDFKKNYLVIVRNFITIVALFVSIFIIWQYQNNHFEKDIAMFRLSMVSALFFPFIFIMSLLTKEVVAKGGIVSKNDFPFLYYISLFVVLLMCIISIIGVIYYL